MDSVPSAKIHPNYLYCALMNCRLYAYCFLLVLFCECDTVKTSNILQFTTNLLGTGQVSFLFFGSSIENGPAANSIINSYYLLYSFIYQDNELPSDKHQN